MGLLVDNPKPHVSEEKFRKILFAMSDRFSAHDADIITTVAAGYFKPHRKRTIDIPEIRMLDAQLARLLPEAAQAPRREFIRRLTEAAHQAVAKKAADASL